MMNINQHQYLAVLGQINLDEVHIKQTFTYYQQRYLNSQIAQQFVQSHCQVLDDHCVDAFVGFCDRTMGTYLPKAKSPERAAIRGSLQRCGLIRASGHELFRGCIVFSSVDERDNIISATGYRIGRTRKGDKLIIYWHKPEPKAFVDTGMSYAKELINAKAYH
ncbi:hypothetical protein [Colwellia psychrerythraea]|uniref:Uncharacterized protein n=1 Tax=Colwellia psychrerythraea TaxID=28229 RepID=A0A099KE75_COLPS|nr:hypothetical protein [Colwellia psychrerythraea]KGJ88611.1 hypothetical protein ND2E_3909 [Colwellia psychrerythraea]